MSTPVIVAVVAVAVTAAFLFCRGGSAAKKLIDKLILASFNGQNDDVEALLKGKPDAISLVDGSGNHALSAAIAGGHLELSQSLLEKRAPLHLANSMGCSPVWLAAGYGQLEILELLIDRIRVETPDDEDEAVRRALNATNGSGDSAVLAAVSQGQVPAVRRLLECRADPSLGNKKGALPLHVATQNGDTELVAILTAGGADAAVVDSRRLTPLHVAASVQGGVSSKLLDSLLAARADLAAKDLNGATPLAVAAHCGCAKMVEALVRPSLLEMPDNDGRPPLWVAASLGKLDAVRALVAAGANVDGVSGSGDVVSTSADVAAKNGKVEVVEFLRSCRKS